MKVISIPVIAALGLAFAPSARADDDVLDLSGAWLFKAGDSPAFASPGLDDAGWEKRSVPMRTASWGDRWHGQGWYRAHVKLEHTPQESMMLSLGPAREAVQVYVNGTLVAKRGDFSGTATSGARALPLSGMVPQGILSAGDNVIAVRVFDPTYGGGLVDGPLLLGPVDPVERVVQQDTRFILLWRIGLGLLALVLGVGMLFVTPPRLSSYDAWWLAGAGAALAGTHLSGIGLFDALMPAAMSSRIPAFLSPLAILSLGSYYAAQYDDVRAQHVTIGQIVLILLSSLNLLLPSAAVYFASDPLILLGGLAVTLYSAGLCVQAIRRSDSGALSLFIALAVLAMLLIIDGFTAQPSDALPPLSVMGAVGALAATAAIVTRETLRQYSRVLSSMLHLKRQLESRSSLSTLDAITASIFDADAYLSATINEIAAELSVRRCSLMLKQPNGDLRIRCSVGLPRHATFATIDLSGSISGWVFTSGTSVSDTSLPEELASARGAGKYVTEAFLSCPVQHGGDTVGVLNFSDRNDGGSFEPSDEIIAAEFTEKLALVLSRLPPEAWTAPEPSPAPPKPRVVPEPEPKGKPTAEDATRELGPEDNVVEVPFPKTIREPRN